MKYNFWVNYHIQLKNNFYAFQLEGKPYSQA